MFIDNIHLLVQAGDGGSGCESYFRRTDRKILPNGGDGGHGGSIIFRADPNAPPLSSFRMRQHLIAPSGGNGGSSKKRGRNGEDMIVLVKPGTRIFDRARGFMIRELAAAGDEVVVVEGGRGGFGNDGGRESTAGQKGAVLDIEITIRLLADVFLVGLPNSGKSKFLNAMTRAHVKEETYPFTTKTPEVGVWKMSDYEGVTICELPSVYAGSHEGRGMGSDFLKHLEKGKIALYFLDPLSQFSQSLADGLEILQDQVKTAGVDLLKIPGAVVVNKMDLPEAAERAKKEKLKAKMPVFYVSAETREGFEKLMDFLKENLKEQA